MAKGAPRHNPAPQEHFSADEQIQRLIEENKQKRQLIHELNAATRDANTAADRCRQADAALKATIGKYDGDINAHYSKMIQDALERFRTTVVNVRDDVGRNVRDHFSALLGAQDADALLAFMCKELIDTIGPAATRAVEEMLERQLPGLIQQAVKVELGIAAHIRGPRIPKPPDLSSSLTGDPQLDSMLGQIADLIKADNIVVEMGQTQTTPPAPEDKPRRRRRGA
jgi:hypothetical protein